MDKVQNKKPPFTQVLHKPNYKGKRVQLLQEEGVDALSEFDQKALIQDLLDAEENSGLIQH